MLIFRGVISIGIHGMGDPFQPHGSPVRVHTPTVAPTEVLPSFITCTHHRWPCYNVYSRAQVLYREFARQVRRVSWRLKGVLGTLNTSKARKTNVWDLMFQCFCLGRSPKIYHAFFVGMFLFRMFFCISWKTNYPKNTDLLGPQNRWFWHPMTSHGALG